VWSTRNNSKTCECKWRSTWVQPNEQFLPTIDWFFVDPYMVCERYIIFVLLQITMIMIESQHLRHYYGQTFFYVFSFTVLFNRRKKSFWLFSTYNFTHSCSSSTVLFVVEEGRNWCCWCCRLALRFIRCSPDSNKDHAYLFHRNAAADVFDFDIILDTVVTIF